jgi:hypothetical protein
LAILKISIKEAIIPFSKRVNVLSIGVASISCILRKIPEFAGTLPEASTSYTQFNAGTRAYILFDTHTPGVLV